jgi:hypothetical protein
MKNDTIELPKMSMVSLLRWLALLEIIIGLVGVIVLAVVFANGIGTAALIFIGLKLVVFIAVLLYSLSYMMPSVANMKTFLGAPIQKFLRYSIYVILTLGFLELIFAILASSPGAAGEIAFYTSIFTGLFSTIVAAVVFYSVYLLIDSKKSPEVEETKSPAAKAKKPTGSVDKLF